MIVKNIDEIKVIQAHGEAFYKYFYMRKDIYHYLKMDDILTTLGGFWETTVNPGKKLEPHTHKDHEQIYYIIEGKGLLTIGDETRRVKPGDAIYIPPATSHEYNNDADEPTKIIMVDVVIPFYPNIIRKAPK